MPNTTCPYAISASYTRAEDDTILITAAYLSEVCGHRLTASAPDYDRRFYVYALLEPNGRAGYIGKGEGDRWMAHEKEARGTSNRTKKHRWIRAIWRDGQRLLRAKVAWNICETDAFAIEEELIANIGLDNLTNIASGGSNPFAGLSAGYIREIVRARARLQKRQKMPKVATNYIQEVCARHPRQTVEQLMTYLLHHIIPWEAGREGTKNKKSLMTLIRQGADEMFAVLGVTSPAGLRPARLFLARTAIDNPDWTAGRCIAFMQEKGPDPYQRADGVVVTDMRGVLRKYAVITNEGKYRIPLRASDESDPAPDADPELEGPATGTVSPSTGRGPGGNWHPDLPEEVLEVRVKARRAVTYNC